MPPPRQSQAQLLGAFARENPDLQQVPTGGLQYGPEPAAQYSVCGAERTLLAGGELAQRLAHPTFVPLEYLFRKLPQQGIFTASPANNFRFELGAFVVPSNMTLALVDYRFDIYRLSGFAPGDFIPIEPRRLSGQIGYDVQISDYRKGNNQFQLEPTPIAGLSGSQSVLLSQATEPVSSGGTIAQPRGIDLTWPPSIGPFAPGVVPNPFAPSSPPFGASPSDFANARAASASAASGAGLGLLPQRPERQGPLPLPFTFLVRSTQRVAFFVVVFRPVPIPLAFFEVSMSGVLLPTTQIDLMMNSMRPCVPVGQGVPPAGAI